jgi:hypothetical protein
VFDCGLFAVGVVLHLIEGIDVTRETFRQQGVTNLQSTLVTVFGGDGADLGTTSQVVRDCFPQSRGSSILDSFGLEVVHNITRCVLVVSCVFVDTSCIWVTNG